MPLKIITFLAAKYLQGENKMTHHLTPHKGPKSHPAPVKHFISQFWNMLDFPSSGELGNMEPRIDVKENKKDIRVTAELPGVAEEDINVEISTDGDLTISGEKRHETETTSNDSYISEISYGMVKRTIHLPWDLDFSATNADYEDGILKISIPKSAVEQEKRKKIAVKRRDKKNK